LKKGKREIATTTANIPKPAHKTLGREQKKIPEKGELIPQIGATHKKNRNLVSGEQVTGTIKKNHGVVKTRESEVTNL